MKKKKLIIVLASILAIVLVGGTLAAFTASSNPILKAVGTSTLGVEVVQKLDDEQSDVDWLAEKNDKGQYVYSGVIPGDKIKQSVFVENTKSKPCYVRVTINRTWLKDGEKYFEVSPEGIELNINNHDWLIQEDPNDLEMVYCYYPKPIDVNEKTSDVLQSFSVLTQSIAENSNAYSGLSIGLTFDVDAVQTTAAEDAMLAEWGIIPSFDENGTLTGYTEQ